MDDLPVDSRPYKLPILRERKAEGAFCGQETGRDNHNHAGRHRLQQLYVLGTIFLESPLYVFCLILD